MKKQSKTKKMQDYLNAIKASASTPTIIEELHSKLIKNEYKILDNASQESLMIKQEIEWDNGWKEELDIYEDSNYEWLLLTDNIDKKDALLFHQYITLMYGFDLYWDIFEENKLYVIRNKNEYKNVKK